MVPLLLFFAAPGLAQPAESVTPADLMRHIEILAADDFQGRKPGTEGETKTLFYLARELHARGLKPAGPDGSWYQPVELVERSPQGHRATWRSGGAALPAGSDDLVLIGRSPSERIAGAPVVFAGHGAVLPAYGIDQLAGAELAGAVALVLYDAPAVPGFPSFADRTETLRQAGAAAVIAIIGPDLAWEAVQRNYAAGTTRLGFRPPPPILGAMPLTAAHALLRAAGHDLTAMLDAQPGSSFRVVVLDVEADLEVATAVRPYTSYNLLGRIAGADRTSDNLLFLAHWDHLGICRPEGEEDRICNGAVDNASGLAAMIEIAGRLAAGPRPERDLLFLATTAEEIGLLGAEHYVARPTVPLESIVAAVNLDTVAVHPAGKPVAVIGRGVKGLDAAIAATVAQAGRSLDTDDEADALVQRQDGWAFTRAGVPAVMVGGSISDLGLLGAFLSGPYHGPDDEIGPGLVLEGAAEDADLLVALGRRLADPAFYTRPEGQTEQGMD